jgi:hypothetical protein
VRRGRQTVVADDAHLARDHRPDAEIVAGYSAGLMSAATDPQGFGDRPRTSRRSSRT